MAAANAMCHVHKITTPTYHEGTFYSYMWGYAIYDIHPKHILLTPNPVKPRMSITDFAVTQSLQSTAESIPHTMQSFKTIAYQLRTFGTNDISRAMSLR